MMFSPAEKTDIRIVPDRRKRPTPFICRFTFSGGRRKTVRRESDKKKHILVDSYSTYLLITILFLLILNLFDSYFTLTLISGDIAVEANPIMALYLEFDDVSFVALKFLITAVSLFGFCLCRNFSISKVFLAAAIVIYLFIVLYELNIVYKFSPYF